MPRRLLLSPLVISCVVICLVVAELATGTSVHFVSMMAVAVLSACLTYNMLGGLRTIAGLGFSGFALGTFFIAQIGKAVSLERADQNLDVPQLTISVYALYFFSLMVGTFVFSRVRLPLPKPAEPETPAQARLLYFIALGGGLVGTVGMAVMTLQGEGAVTSVGHGFARALAYLLPFSLVLTVDDRIRSSDGKHCLGWMALWPTLAMLGDGFLSASRSVFMEPFAIIFLTCFLREFRFRKRHVCAAVGVAVLFFAFISPYYLYARGWRGTGTTLSEEASTMIRVLQSAPSEWGTIKNSVGDQALGNPGAVNYFSSSAAVTLNRFALIGPDSTLINACSTGFHYGFTSLRLDLLSQVPRFIYKNKPEFGADTYLGQLDGQESDVVETTIYSTVTTVSDSYGAFGWLGVVAFALVVIPSIFVTYQSMFDISRPWGTVAAVSVILGIGGGTMGDNIAGVLIKYPLYILILSWCAMWVVRMIPTTGDRVVQTVSTAVRPVAQAGD